MDNYTTKIFAPIPVYTVDRDFLNRLQNELQDEKLKTSRLTTELEFEKHKSQQMESLLYSLINLNSGKNQEDPLLGEEKRIPKNESTDTLASLADITETMCSVGVYTNEVRRRKIMKYKEKIKKYRLKVHVSRDFKGRSIIAKVKPRIHGKFAKCEVNQ